MNRYVVQIVLSLWVVVLYATRAQALDVHAFRKRQLNPLHQTSGRFSEVLLPEFSLAEHRMSWYTRSFIASRGVAPAQRDFGRWYEIHHPNFSLDDTLKNHFQAGWWRTFSKAELVYAADAFLAIERHHTFGAARLSGPVLKVLIDHARVLVESDDVDYNRLIEPIYASSVPALDRSRFQEEHHLVTKHYQDIWRHHFGIGIVSLIRRLSERTFGGSKKSEFMENIQAAIDREVGVLPIEPKHRRLMVNALALMRRDIDDYETNMDRWGTTTFTAIVDDIFDSVLGDVPLRLGGRDPLTTNQMAYINAAEEFGAELLDTWDELLGVTEMGKYDKMFAIEDPSILTLGWRDFYPHLEAAIKKEHNSLHRKAMTGERDR